MAVFRGREQPGSPLALPSSIKYRVGADERRHEIGRHCADSVESWHDDLGERSRSPTLAGERRRGGDPLPTRAGSLAREGCDGCVGVEPVNVLPDIDQRLIGSVVGLRQV